MAVMAFTGMSVAQDVWSSGYYTQSNGIRCSAVFKNNAVLHSNGISSGAGFYGMSSDVVVYNEDVWWADNL